MQALCSLSALALAALALLPSHASALASRHPRRDHTRSAFIGAGLSSVGAVLLPARVEALSASALSSPPESTRTVIYRPLSIDVDGVAVPVAAWHQLPLNDNELPTKTTYYEHRIAVSKIGKSLAGWSLPSFVDREFSLAPTADGSRNVQTVSFARDQPLPQSAPVVLLAHGYLGSRFDLSHLAEALASQGFLVVAAEYPESLAASYDASQSQSGIPLDRTIITDRLLQKLTTEWNVAPTSYGIVGHSLGCGTVDRVGDASWARVCLAGGYPSLRGPNCLFIGSAGDGAVAVGRAYDALRQYDFAPIDEETARLQSWEKLPARGYLIFNSANAPNHISFLSDRTNDAMIDFLSPLLPLARALKIPVLDFDKYQVSRDSRATGEVVIPLVVAYLKQKMGVS